MMIPVVVATIARQQLVVVHPGSDAVISLTAFPNSDVTVHVTSLPATGSLFQLSKVFSKYSYDPKAGVAVVAGDQVTGSKNRVYYARPQYDVERSGKWGEIVFSVGAHQAMVTLVGPSLRLVASTFDISDDNWRIVRNKATTATFEQSSFGFGLNRFLVATDDLIARDFAGVEVNSSRWMFQAPSLFHGHHAAAYGGSIVFTLGALAGDLATHQRRHHNLVELESSNGVRLAFPAWLAPPFDGKTTSFNVSLHEAAGWIQDPYNELKQWPPPSKCTFIHLLSSLSAFRILGDWSDWYESIALDDVAFVAPSTGKTQVPICAQMSPCSCSD